MLSASSYGHFTAAKEFRSQCHIFRFGNIGYCCEIDIFIDQNIAYCCEIDITMLKKVALSDFSGPPGFYGSHRGVPPGFHRVSTGVPPGCSGDGGFGRYLVEVRFP